MTVNSSLRGLNIAVDTPRVLIMRNWVYADVSYSHSSLQSLASAKSCCQTVYSNTLLAVINFTWKWGFAIGWYGYENLACRLLAGAKDCSEI